MSLNSTPGDALANSYGSVLESNDYFAIGYRKEAWSSVIVLDKEKLLKEATRLLDQFYSWNGYMDPDSIQALRWPRRCAYDQDRRVIDDAIVPTTIKNASFELAFHINAGSTGFDISENTLDQIRVGPIRLDFSKNVKEQAFPKIVIDMLQYLGDMTSKSSNSVTTARLVRT